MLAVLVDRVLAGHLDPSPRTRRPRGPTAIVPARLGPDHQQPDARMARERVDHLGIGRLQRLERDPAGQAREVDEGEVAGRADDEFGRLPFGLVGGVRVLLGPHGDDAVLRLAAGHARG